MNNIDWQTLRKQHPNHSAPYKTTDQPLGTTQNHILTTRARKKHPSGDNITSIGELTVDNRTLV